MGLTIQPCSCIKSGNEEKLTEFIPSSSDNIHTRNKNLLIKKDIIDFTPSPLTTQENYDLQLRKDITFSFRKIQTKNEDIEKIKRIQVLFRAYNYRKKFFGEKGIKNLLKNYKDEIIQKKESEYITNNLTEMEEIIKKEFNDDFLSKLQIKESIKKSRLPDKRKIKTECLIKTDSNGEEFLYRGELDLDGNFFGYGELYLKSGKKYEGKFKDNKLNDYGRLIDLNNKKCYEGIFKDNELIDGQGKIIAINEDGSKTIYNGEIKAMKKEGKGIEIKKDNTYTGQFKNDLKHGKGKLTYNNGKSFYEGDFLNGKITGYGFYQYEENQTYEGELLEGQRNGKGLFKWKDGTEYEGNYVNNLREGFGEYRTKTGNKYRGIFKAGKKQGKFTVINKKGHKKEVEYIDDKAIKK